MLTELAHRTLAALGPARETNRPTKVEEGKVQPSGWRPNSSKTRYRGPEVEVSKAGPLGGQSEDA